VFGVRFGKGEVHLWHQPTGQNMNVLIQIKDNTTDRELRDFNESLGNSVYFARSSEESINILNSKEIGQAVVNLKGLSDAAILKYLNDYCPDTEVIVLTSKGFDDLLSLFRETRYKVIYEPLKLSELKTKDPARKNLA
jgi:DNA-binding NtrC family response regulator